MQRTAHLNVGQASTGLRNHIGNALLHNFGRPVAEIYKDETAPLAEPNFGKSLEACQKAVTNVIRKDPIYPWPGKTNSRPPRVRLKGKA